MEYCAQRLLSTRPGGIARTLLVDIKIDEKITNLQLHTAVSVIRIKLLLNEVLRLLLTIK